jgi:mono/diheme cytochrome c family protein
VIIMALGEHSTQPVKRAVRTASASRLDEGHGRELYTHICSICHGATGELVAGHDLKSLRDRRDLASTISFIKNPVAPMPKLYPNTLSEQDVADVAAYLQQGGWK